MSSSENITYEQLLDNRIDCETLARKTKYPKEVSKCDFARLGEMQYKQEVEAANKLMGYDFDYE